MATGAADARVSALSVGIALALHAIIVAAVATVPSPLGTPAPPPVEFEFREPPPPPPEIHPPPPPPPEPEPPKPKVVVRRTPLPPPPTPEAPPPPNQEPPPETPPPSAPPTFGVTMDSVVSGESGMAVPVGNTLMAKPAPARKAAGPPQPYAGSGSLSGAPAAEVSVATLPRVLFQVDGAEIYPPDARALGIEGRVKASITVSEKGDVSTVRILERAGHGFDEAAAQALRRFRFAPARTSDGRAVPYRLTWDFRFSIGE